MKRYKDTLALYEKKDKYLKEFKGDSEYAVLEKLFENLMDFRAQYCYAVMYAPQQIERPMDPDTAGTLGTLFGGLAVGIVAARNAMEN